MPRILNKKPNIPSFKNTTMLEPFIGMETMKSSKETIMWQWEKICKISLHFLSLNRKEEVIMAKKDNLSIHISLMRILLIIIQSKKLTINYKRKCSLNMEDLKDNLF